MIVARLNRQILQSQRGSFVLFLKTHLARLLSSGGGLLLPCPLRALSLLAFCCRKHGFCAFRFACFLRFVSPVASAALRYSLCASRALAFGFVGAALAVCCARCVSSLVKVRAREGAATRRKSPTTG